MNGSILGMRRSEIAKNFDAIVDFAGVEQFIDTPLKHYSSGMQLRLAFAVAAFLENEILIIDEVLAVGDAEFQKKCLGKMEDVSKSGRTVLFVSHDLNSLSNICKTAILLSKGEIIESGETSKVVSKYLHANDLNTSWKQTEAISSPVYFNSLQIEVKGQQPELALHIKFTLHKNAAFKPSFVAFNISNQMGQMIGQAIPVNKAFIEMPDRSSEEFHCEIELKGFVPDEYFLSAWIGPYYSETYDWQKEILSFTIIESPQANRLYPHARECGAIVPFSKMIV
jgi:lipopolysaccharide transport system ATP-binding protein